eukprot:3023069-Karenia_brevis.AAC.1
MSKEISVRAGQLERQTLLLRKTVGSNPHVPVANRLLAVQAYLLSAGFYNAGTWPKLTSAQYKKLHTVVSVSYTHLRAHETLSDL